MPRINRGLEEGHIYHILNRGNAKQKIFHTKQDYEDFINLVKKAKELHPIKLFAYCLMPNHFHMVVMPARAEELSNFMQWLMTSHVRRHHKRYDTSGHIWQGRFKSFMVYSDSHLLSVLRYVEGNPVRAGIVKSATDWCWSSYNEKIADNKYRILIDKPPIELPENWNELIDQTFNEQELKGIQQSINRGSPYGPSEWRRDICKKLGLESTIRARGRPKKELTIGQKK